MPRRPISVAEAAAKLQDRCPAISQNTGIQCKNRAGAGTDHKGFGLCKFHLGNTPAAKRNAETIRAATTVQQWGGRLNVTPVQALVELVQTKAAEVAYWQFKVSELTEHERAGLLVAGVEVKSGMEATGVVETETVKKAAGPHAFVVLLHKAQDQLAQYSAAAIRAGLDEAMVRVAALQASAVIEFARRAIVAARQHAGTDPDQIILELLPDDGQ